MISLKISPLRLVLIAVVLLIGLPSIAQITSNSPVCDSDNLQIQADLNGDEFTLFGPGDSQLDKNNSGVFDLPAAGLNSGDYRVEVFDNSNGSTSSEKVYIEIIRTPSKPSITGKSTICEGRDFDWLANYSGPADKVAWNFEGGEYREANPLLLQANSGLGTFVTVVVSNQGCESRPTKYNFDVLESPNNTPNADVQFEESFCEDDDIVFTASGKQASQSIEWEMADGTIFNSTTLRTTADLAFYGETKIRFVNPNGCPSPEQIFYIEVNVTPYPAEANKNIEQLCTSEELNLRSTNTGAYTAEWKLPNGNTLQNDRVYKQRPTLSDSGIYVLTLYNKNCPGPSDTVVVSLAQAPELISYETNAPVCEGDSLFITTNYRFGETNLYRSASGKSYTGDTIIIYNVKHDEDFKFRIGNDNGCISKYDTIDTPVLESLPEEVYLYSFPRDTFCEDQYFEVGTYEYEFTDFIWEGPRGFTSQFAKNPLPATPNRSGRYTLTLRNLCDTVTGSVFVKINPKPEFTIEGDSIMCPDIQDESTLRLEGLNETDIILWSNNDTTDQIFPEREGYYTVRVENEFGCVEELGKDVGLFCEPRFFAPSAFSPNGDFINDEFKVVTHNVDNALIQIFNMAGQLVYKSRDLNEGWDGQISDKGIAQTGRYFYRIDYDMIYERDVVSKEYFGFFLLVR